MWKKIFIFKGLSNRWHLMLQIQVLKCLATAYV